RLSRVRRSTSCPGSPQWRHHSQVRNSPWATFFDGVTTTRNISAAPLQPAGYQLRFCRQQAGLGRRRVLQELAHQFQRGVLVSLGLDQHVENLALSINGPPQVDHLAVDFQIDLVEMPRRVRLRATLSQVGRNHWSETVHPTPNRLVGHRQSAFRQQILDVAQAEAEPEIEPYCLVNDLGREPVSDVADFLHPLGYSATGQTASPMRRDNAVDDHASIPRLGANPPPAVAFELVADGGNGLEDSGVGRRWRGVVV